MPRRKVEEELTPEKAMEIVLKLRKQNRDSARTYREKRVREGYAYFQAWVPVEVMEVARTAVNEIISEAERNREERALKAPPRPRSRR